MKPNLLIVAAWTAAAVAILLPQEEVHASLVELTARPATGDTIYWGQIGTPNLTLTGPQSFTSADGTTGNVSFNGTGFLVEQCCVGIVGTFDGDFAPGDVVVVANSPLSINFNTPVQSMGAQIQDNRIGDMFTAEILAFNGSALLGTFTESGFSGDLGDNSNIFLGVQDGSADITSVTYLTFTASPEFSLQDVAINQVSIAVNPLPAALPLFVTGLGAMCLLFWLRKRKPLAAS
jgi:hypothetical protein